MAKKVPSKKAAPYGYTELVWAETLDPEYAAARAHLGRVAMREGVLSVKVKEMIIIGILASRSLQYGVAAHMRRAVEFGATREELFEGLKAAHLPGGGLAFSVGLRALQELEFEGTFKMKSIPSPRTKRIRKKAP